MKRNKMLLAGAALAAAAGMGTGAARAASYTCTAAIDKCQFDGETGGFGPVSTSPSATATDTFNLVFNKAGTFTVSITTTKLELLSLTFLGQTLVPTKGQDYTFTVATPGPYTLGVTTQNLTGKSASFSASFDFAPVPEPAAWGMMIAGVGMAGATLRRRRGARVANA